MLLASCILMMYAILLRYTGMNYTVHAACRASHTMWRMLYLCPVAQGLGQTRSPLTLTRTLIIALIGAGPRTNTQPPDPNPNPNYSTNWHRA